MYQYRIYGMCLLSDIEFLQLQVLTSGEAAKLPRVTVAEAPFPMQFKRDEDCFSHIAEDVSYLSNSYCYLLIERGNRISYEKKRAVPDTLLRAYLLGWGIAMLCHQRGLPALHGSCVAGPEGAVLLCGNSGSDKSTLTAELLARGFSLMADDVSVLTLEADGTVSARSAFPYQKLCRDAAEHLNLPREELIYIDEKKDKFLVPYKGPFPLTPVPVRAVVFLTVTPEDTVSFTELSGVQKFQACMHSLFLKPLFGEALYAPENGIIGLTLASRLPVYLIGRPANKDCRNEIISRLLTRLNG